MFSFLLSRYQGVELLGYIVTEELPNYFLKWMHHFIFPPAVCEGSDFSTSSPVFFIIVILMDIIWYLTVVLICISLITNHVGHLFTYLLAMCLSSLKKCLFISFAHFLFGLLLSCMCPLYVVDSRLLLDVSFANIFSYSVCCLFTFLMVSFEVQKFILIKSSLPIFLLLLVFSGSYLGIFCQIQDHEENAVY